MYLIDFVQTEWLKIAKEEINSIFKLEEALVLSEGLKIPEFEDSWYEPLLETLKEHKQLKELKNSIFILDLFFKVKNFSTKQKDVMKQKKLITFLENRLANNPANKMNTFCVFVAKHNFLLNQEYFEIELTDFFTELFEKYDFLIQMHDFFDQTRLLDIDIPVDVWGSDNFILIFENAMKKYPNKFEIKERLAHVYFFKKELTKTLSIINLFLENLNDKQKSFLYNTKYEFIEQRNHLEFLQLRGRIYYDLKMFDKALIDMNAVLDNLPEKLENWSLGPYGNYPIIGRGIYIQANLIRITINLKKQGNQNDLSVDFSSLTNKNFHFDSDLWEKSFPEAIQYIKKRLKNKL